VSTPANPQGLLRRPKKSAQTPSGGPPIIAIAAAVVIVGGAAAGAYAMFGHPHATQTATAAAPGDQYAMVSRAVTEPAHLDAGRTKRKETHAAASPKPSPGASPTAAPSAAPSATPQSTDSSSAASAHARHLAALRLAALRRAQAAASQVAQTTPTSGTTSASASESQLVVSTPPPIATATPQPTQTPEAAPTPVYAPRIVVDARFVNRVAPDYPSIAREQGSGGTAIVLATVGPSGSVISVAIDQSTGNKLLDAAALTAARESTFEAPEIDGTPATETYRIVYTFDPNQ
jgi:TonB family protein